MKFKTLLMLISIFSFVKCTNTNLEDPLGYLKSNAVHPAKYIINKFKSADVILLGEDHRIKQNLEFIHDLIPQLYRAGVYNLGMEFGAYEDQKTLDSLVNAEKYDEALARQLMFNYNVGWAFKEYLDVYKVVWEFNKTLAPKSKKFRVFNMSYIYDWTQYQEPYTDEVRSKVFHKGEIDLFRANLIDNKIIKKGEKILVLTGTVHAFTRYKFFRSTNNLNDSLIQVKMLGNYLYERYPKKVGSFLIHQPFGSISGLVSPANGKIEAFMAELNNQPKAFDLIGTPIGQLSDSSTYSFGYSNFKLEDLFDGYIFLNPLNQLEGCTIDELFLTEGNWPIAQPQQPDPNWRKPKETMEEYWQSIKKYVDVKSAYKNVDKDAESGL